MRYNKMVRYLVLILALSGCSQRLFLSTYVVDKQSVSAGFSDKELMQSFANYLDQFDIACNLSSTMKSIDCFEETGKNQYPNLRLAITKGELIFSVRILDVYYPFSTKETSIPHENGKTIVETFIQHYDLIEAYTVIDNGPKTPISIKR